MQRFVADVAGMVTSDGIASVQAHAARVVGQQVSDVSSFAVRQRQALAMGLVVILACAMARTYGSSVAALLG